MEIITRHALFFYNAIRKYGWGSFTPEILTSTESQQEANELEIYYIGLYKSTDRNIGYNIAMGGDSGAISEETRKIISEKAVERYKDKSKNPMFGRKHTEESIKKMSEAKIGENNPMYGTKWTERQRTHCGTKGKKLNISDEHREKLRENAKRVGLEVGLKSVYCIEDDIVFKSITEAAKHYNIAISTLSGCLNGRQKTSAGKHFKFC